MPVSPNPTLEQINCAAERSWRVPYASTREREVSQAIRTIDKMEQRLEMWSTQWVVWQPFGFKPIQGSLIQIRALSTDRRR